MKNRVGQPVSGEDFFDREAEQAQLWRYLDTDSVLLLAPRRVGKTSLMKRLVEDAPGRGYNAFYVSVEGAVDESEFVLRLYRAVSELDTDLAERILQPILESAPLEVLKRVQSFEGFGFSIELSEAEKRQWPDLAITLGRALEAVEGRWLLAIDELPVFVLKLLKADPTTERAAQFLHRLRELRQGLPHTRWLLAGSIGLDTVTGRHDLGDTINDLRSSGLGPFDSETAASFLLELSRTYPITLTPQIRTEIIGRLSWPIPYYLQLIFSKLLDLGERAPRLEQIDAVFEGLLSPAHKKEFDYWKQRLHEELGTPDDQLAVALLSAICRDPTGASKETLRQRLAESISDPTERDQRLRYLLDVLETDGYLIPEDGRYRFRMPLLREYWLRRIAE